MQVGTSHLGHERTVAAICPRHEVLALGNPALLIEIAGALHPIVLR